MSSFHDINIQYEPTIPSGLVGPSASSTNLSASQILQKTGLLVFDNDETVLAGDLFATTAFGDPSEVRAAAVSINMPTAPDGSNVEMDGQYYSPIEDLFNFEPFAQIDDNSGTTDEPYFNLSEKTTWNAHLDLWSPAGETLRYEADKFQDLASGLSYSHDSWTRRQIDSVFRDNTDCYELLFDVAVSYSNTSTTRELQNMTEDTLSSNYFRLPIDSFTVDGMMDEISHMDFVELNNRTISKSLFENQIQSSGEVSDRPKKRSFEASSDKSGEFVSQNASFDDHSELQPIKKRMLNPFKSTRLIWGRRINKTTHINGNNRNGRKGTLGCELCRKRKRQCIFYSEWLPCKHCRDHQIKVPCIKLRGPKARPTRFKGTKLILKALLLPWMLCVNSIFPFKIDPPKLIFQVTEDDDQDHILKQRVRIECKRLDAKWRQLSQFKYTDLRRAPSELRFYCWALLNIIRLSKLSLELTFHSRKIYHQHHVHRLLAEAQDLCPQIDAVLRSIARYMPLRLRFACGNVSTLVHVVYDRIVTIVEDLPLPLSNLEDAWVGYVVSQITEVKAVLDCRLNGKREMEEIESVGIGDN